MSGPVDTASIWEKVLFQSTEENVRKDWVALCAAWDTFHGSMERHLGMAASTPPMMTPSMIKPTAAAPAAPPPAAVARPFIPGMPMMPIMSPMPMMPMMPPVPVKAAEPPPPPVMPAKPTDAELAAREKRVMDSIQSISNTMTAKITQIQTSFMSGAFGPNQVNPMMSEQYNWGIGAFQTLRVEASALADAGKRDALKTLDLFVDDTKKAIAIVGGMVNQQRVFEMDQAKIWNDTNRSITETQMEMNRKTRDAFARANEKWSDNF